MSVRARAHMAVLLSADCDFALDIVAHRPRSIRSIIEYVILTGSSLSSLLVKEALALALHNTMRPRFEPEAC